jgi:hypothetical protein
LDALRGHLFAVQFLREPVERLPELHVHDVHRHELDAREPDDTDQDSEN